jgi:ribosomal protein S18 acetylase RimI-like enzyme
MYTIRPAARADGPSLLDITARTAVFTAEEKDCVKELWDDFLSNGENSPYHFCVCCEDQALVGYACYGKHALTEKTYDLYWIAVDPGFQGKGAGSDLLNYVEEQVSEQADSKLVIETSSTSAYRNTRKFYKKHHYRTEAVLKDFYSEGDDLVIFIKTIRSHKNGSQTPPEDPL